MRRVELDQKIVRTAGIILAGAAMGFGADAKFVSANDSMIAVATAATTPTRVLITPIVTLTPNALATARANNTALTIELNQKAETDALNRTAVVLSDMLTATLTRTPTATRTLTPTATGTPLPTETQRPTLSSVDGTATSETRIDVALGKEMAQGKMTVTAQEAKTATAEAKKPSPTTGPTSLGKGSNDEGNQGGFPWEVPVGVAGAGIAGRELYRRNGGVKNFINNAWAVTKAVAGVIFRH